ncbi:MAG TPA: hypothetical protein VFW33_01785 [Gemmataceae bacterium]|nr:hypothetical protein [Gemmataceae bacterium]
MGREDFILNIRLAESELHPPQVWTDSPRASPADYAAILASGDPWLTPKSVEDFNAADFPPQQGAALKQEVEGFVAVASQVDPAKPATKAQVRAARPHLERIAAILGDLIKDEWLLAVKALVDEAESWAQKQHWAVKRDSKTIREPLLGEYAAPRLLIHSPDGRLLLDPVKAFWTGRNGLVEFCVLPSYDSAKIFREGGGWRVYPLRPNGRAQAWSETTFLKAARQLLQGA